jgi:predicted ArsR family transcriptional regulator
MTQLAIDFGMAPMARRRDPITSHMAAEQAKEMAQRHHALILSVLRKHGPLGKDGIASRLRGLDGVAVCRRLTELQRLGEIEETGRTVKSSAGRSEREWRVV